MLRLPAETSDRLGTESYRRQREAEIAKKGEAALNPHIPDYIAKAPWYAADFSDAALAHHRKKEEEKSTINEWYERGATAGPAAKKYRKGACENCGAMTHTRKDCVERPRKRGAKYSNKDIRADEVIQAVPRDYDAKRDRWNGYDPRSYANVVEDYEAAEEARRKFREEEIDAQTSTDLAAVKKIAKKDKKTEDDSDDEFGSSDDDDDADQQHAEDAADQVSQKVDTNSRLTVRNLRIREDTAKYLLNLDPESAYYDPKTRAMRDAPEQNVRPEDMKFAGDNFLRYSGESTNMQKLQVFAWQSAQRGHNVNVHSNPTAGELLHREFLQKRDVLKNTNKTSILEKYGGEEHLERLPDELLGGQTEHYVEYSRTGQLLKGQEKAVARSKYAEDVYTNNHTSVWGSFFDRDTGKWGYACCHSIISGSYCTGEAGKNANVSSSAAALLEVAEEEPEEAPKSLVEMHRERMAQQKKDDEERSKEPKLKAKGDDSRFARDDSEPELDRAKLRRALEAERKRKAMGDDEAWAATKKSKTDITDEDMEAYRLSKQTFEDPMANYQDTEE